MFHFAKEETEAQAGDASWPEGIAAEFTHKLTNSGARTFGPRPSAGGTSADFPDSWQKSQISLRGQCQGRN